MPTTLLLLTTGLVLLLGGGELLVRGASGLARLLGIAPLVVGLTVVAFGTSAPELAVNLLAALRGTGELAFGNVVGSNLANIGLVLGLAAVLRPLHIEGRIIVREVPMMLLATAAATVLVLDGPLRGQQAMLDRADGLLLLLLFGLFLYTTIGDVIRQRRGDPLLIQAETELGPAVGTPRAGRCLVATGVGLAGLLAGGELTVRAAVELALAMGVSEAVVGLTVVAVGTSLPELVTTVMAVRHGEPDLAVGNVVGSNVFNLLFVLGTTATIAPVPVPPEGAGDILAVLGLSALLLPLTISNGRRLVRWEGLLLLALTLAYDGWRAWPAA